MKNNRLQEAELDNLAPKEKFSGPEGNKEDKEMQSYFSCKCIDERP